MERFQIALIAPDPGDGGTVTIGLDGEPPTLDPAGNSLSLANGSVYGALFDPLMRLLPGKEPEPLLLDSLVESDDRLSWTLTLKPGISFHDGTPLDAAAVKFNLERQKASPYNGPTLSPITAVDVIDPLNVRLTLSVPWTALPSVLAGVNGLMASPTAAADAAAFARHPVGTGPYQFSEWVPGDKIVVTKNPTYWGTPGHVDEVVYKLIPVEAARVAAFKAGELDAYTSIVVKTADEAKASGAQVVSPPSFGYGFAYINTTRPPLDDARVRRALVLAADRDAISAAYQGPTYADFAWGAIPKDSTWWAAPATPLAYQLDEAKALIQEYGKPVTFSFKLLAGNEEFADGIRATIEYWKEAGIDAELQLEADLSTYVVQGVTGDFDMIGWLGGSIGDPDTTLYNLFHTGGSSNYGKYSNPRVDELLDLARSSNVDADRKAAYDEIQQILREDAPVYFSGHGLVFFIAGDRVKGLDTPTTFFPVRGISVG